jgi:hypothetical protein
LAIVGAAPLATPAEVVASARLERARFDAGGQQIVLDVVAGAPVPLLVKVTWFANWSARDGDGHSLTLYRTTPDFMLVWGRGRITLSYGATALDRALGAMSLACWIAALGLGLAWPRPRRRAGRVAVMVAVAAVAALAAVAGARVTFRGPPPAPSMRIQSSEK